MEMAMTPMTERQRKYRENYRERVAGWYNGRLRILLIYTIGFTALYVGSSPISTTSGKDERRHRRRDRRAAARVCRLAHLPKTFP